MKVRTSSSEIDEPSYWLWCPGCQDTHRITTLWEFDGNLEAPTFSPSILTRGVQWAEGDTFHRPGHSKVPAGGQTVCHSFIRAGQWEFLTDSTHDLAGQTVPMVDLPDWLASE